MEKVASNLETVRKMIYEEFERRLSEDSLPKSSVLLAPDYLETVASVREALEKQNEKIDLLTREMHHRFKEMPTRINTRFVQAAPSPRWILMLYAPVAMGILAILVRSFF